ncbi:hypothetical protein VPH35_099133 [Triticum aestivum]
MGFTPSACGPFAVEKKRKERKATIDNEHNLLLPFHDDVSQSPPLPPSPAAGRALQRPAPPPPPADPSAPLPRKRDAWESPLPSAGLARSGREIHPGCAASHGFARCRAS